MQFPDANSRPANLLFPHDASYFDMMSRFIENEYVDPADMDMRGFPRTIGIEEGRPFSPTPEQHALLDKAAMTSFNISKVVISNMLVNEPDGKYYRDRQWINVFAGEDRSFQSSHTYTNLEQRSGYFTSAYSASPDMVKNLVEMGASRHLPRQGRLHVAKRGAVLINNAMHDNLRKVSVQNVVIVAYAYADDPN